MDLVDLIKLVIPRKEREQGEDFEVDATDSPIVHLVVVVTVCEEAFGRPVPACADVLSERRLGVNSAAGTKVSQFHLIFFQKNVLTKKSSCVRTQELCSTYGLMSL